VGLPIRHSRYCVEQHTIHGHSHIWVKQEVWGDYFCQALAALIAREATEIPKWLGNGEFDPGSRPVGCNSFGNAAPFEIVPDDANLKTAEALSVLKSHAPVSDTPQGKRLEAPSALTSVQEPPSAFGASRKRFPATAESFKQGRSFVVSHPSAIITNDDAF
jgi:hypothetical protein